MRTAAAPPLGVPRAAPATGCSVEEASSLENDRNPNVCYLPKLNILLEPNYSAKSRMQNSTCQ